MGLWAFANNNNKNNGGPRGIVGKNRDIGVWLSFEVLQTTTKQQDLFEFQFEIENQIATKPSCFNLNWTQLIFFLMIKALVEPYSKRKIGMLHQQRGQYRKTAVTLPTLSILVGLAIWRIPP